MKSKLTKVAADRQQVRINAERWLQTGNEKQKDLARQKMAELDRLDAEDEQFLQEEIASSPMEQRVRNAFTRMPPTETELRLLTALIRNPGLTSTQLSSEVGWMGQSWHLHFAQVGKSRQHMLWQPDLSQSTDSDFYCGILADYNYDNGGWTIRPEVKTGLASIGIA